jgi:hypothetical protein
MEWKDIENFLRARGSDGKCPFCKENDWVAVEDDFNLALPVAVAGKRVPSEVLTVGLVCRQCGFLRLHAQDVLAGDVGSRTAEER